MSGGRDFFGADTAALKDIRLFLFDMDGTIYEEDRLFDGARELFDAIRRTGGRYVFITNNSSRSVDDYIAKVRRLGIPADEDNFFTSSQATALYLKKNHPGAKVYCQGTASLVRELSAAGIRVSTEAEDDIQVVLVGFDTELTYEKLRRTCLLLQRDIPFIATNPDLACPVSFGFVPDCGSICQMLANATGRKPLYIGKPEPVMVDIVREKYGHSRQETAVIGDRLYTDIAAGVNAGVISVCVLTGEASPEAIREGAIKPAFTLESVKDLWQICFQ